MKHKDSEEETTGIINHSLPGHAGGDSSWFGNLPSDFQRQETLRQIAYKEKRWPGMMNGHATNPSGHAYPHVLESNLQMALYPGMAHEVRTYLTKRDIAVHSEILNLKSSQAACFNFLFPAHLNPRFGAEFLKPVCKNIHTLTEIEFEYTGPRGTTQWLGEPKGGKRGQNRTSIDAAVFYVDTKGKKCCTLIEWKYTEANFGECSAYKKATKENKGLCDNLNAASPIKANETCLLATKADDYHSRKYWSLLRHAGVNTSAFGCMQGCPFRGAFYQVMRQHLIAHRLRKANVDYVDVVSISFAQNNALHEIDDFLEPLRSGKHGDVIDIWNSVLTDVPPMRHFNIETLMERLGGIQGVDSSWRAYLKERYGV